MSTKPNALHVSTTVWDSFTTETDRVKLRIYHQSGLVEMAKTAKPCPLILSREIHKAYCDHHDVEDPDEYELVHHSRFIGGTLGLNSTLVSAWKNKKTLAITTYTSLLWRSNEIVLD